jgi:hypothetical protein
MQTEQAVAPTTEDIYHVWRADRRLSPGAALVYMRRIRLFRAYCAEHGLVEREELTLERVNRFIDWYAQQRNLAGSFSECCAVAEPGLSLYAAGAAGLAVATTGKVCGNAFACRVRRVPASASGQPTCDRT